MPAPARAARRAVTTAAAVVVAAAVLVLSSLGGAPSSAVAAVALAAALAAGWPVLLALPSPRGTAGVVAGTGVAAALAVLSTPDDPWLRRLPVVLALAVLAACAHQLFRRDLRPRAVDSLGGTLLGAVLAGAASGWVAVPATRGGWSLTLVAVVAASVACLVLLLPYPRRVDGALALVGGAGAAALVAAVLPAVPAAAGAGVGVAVALVVAALDGLLAPLPTTGRVRSRVSMVAAALAASGLAAHLVGRALLG